VYIHLKKDLKSKKYADIATISKKNGNHLSSQISLDFILTYATFTKIFEKLYTTNGNI